MEYPLALAGLFTSSFIIALSGALMPGPLLTFTVAAAARRGFWAGPLIILGHGLLELALLGLLFLGVGALAQSPVFTGLVALVGAGTLWWLGCGLFREAGSAHLSLATGETKSLHPVWAGIMMSLVNPYWLIWWLTLGLGYVMLAFTYGLPGVACFFAGHIAADLGWYTLVSLAVSRGRQFLSDRYYHGFIKGCALFLVGFGCYFGVLGVKMLWWS